MKYLLIFVIVLAVCLVAGFIDAVLDKRKRDKENKKARGE